MYLLQSFFLLPFLFVLNSLLQLLLSYVFSFFSQYCIFFSIFLQFLVPFLIVSILFYCVYYSCCSKVIHKDRHTYCCHFHQFYLLLLLMHSTQWVHMLSPVLPLPLFLYFSCLKMVYLICAVSFSLYNISKSILLCPYLASSIMQSCNWLHLQRINICCVFLYSILLCSMITLNITMLSIFNLSFLPDVCISDILLCIVSFHVFFIFSYTLDIIITKKTPLVFAYFLNISFFNFINNLLPLFRYYFFWLYYIL